jgi:glycosyltransferase involved in cell wall biosynthesis
MLYSIQRQTHRPLEAVLVDDASTATHIHRCLRDFQRMVDLPVRFARNEFNGGTAAALNTALAMVHPKTDIISKLDSDDIMAPTREATRAEAMAVLDDQVALVWDNYYIIEPGRLPQIHTVIGRPYDRDLLLKEAYICGNTTVRAKAYREAGEFGYPGYWGPKCRRHSEDYDMTLRITDDHDAFWLDTDPAESWAYRRHPASKSVSDQMGVVYAKMTVQELARERRKS